MTTKITQATLEVLEALVTEEWNDHRGDWPNLPDAKRYAEHAERIGFKTQQLMECDGPGAYYTAYALYDVDYIFGEKPVGIIFEDFSKSFDVTWVAKF